MKRIAIIGSGGAGKSAMARQLGQLLNINVIHLDAFYWKPGWVESTKPEWRSLQEDLVKQEIWIIDGNYHSTLDIRLAAADTIIFLDYPRTLCIYRAIKRSLQYAGKSRSDMGKDCPEHIDWAFLKWIWSYPTRSRPGILQQILVYSKEGREIIILHSPKETKHFLHKIKGEKHS